jgi:uncharacterized protein YqgV (UPF0045/DUF77 family)
VIEGTAASASVVVPEEPIMIAEFSIYPTDGAQDKEQAWIADELETSGMPYRLGPMSTCVEGDWDDVMAAIRRCHQAVAERHDRVVTTVVIDAQKKTVITPG